MPANKKPSKRAVAKAAKLASATVIVPVAPAVASVAKPDKSADRLARQLATAESHAFVSKLYGGASMPVHRSAPGKLARYISRIQQPGHACTETSDRDHALLRRIGDAVPGISKAGGAFDPCAANIAADLGVISRLASVGYVATDGATVTLTATGATRLRLVSKAA